MDTLFGIRARYLQAAAVFVFGLRAAGCAGSEDEGSFEGPEDAGDPRAEAGVEDAGSSNDGPAPDGRCSSDGWCRVEMPNAKVALYGIWGSSAEDVWAVGSSGAVLHWNGTRWSAQRVLTEAGQGIPLFGVWGSGPRDVWAFSAHEIFHTDRFDESKIAWSTFEVPIQENFLEPSIRSLWGSGGADVWTVLGPTNAWGGGLLDKCWHSEGWRDGSTRLTPVFEHYAGALPGMNFAKVWGTGASDVWLVGETGRIFHTDGYWGGAAVWTQTNSHTRSNLTDVWGAAPDDVWAVGEKGTIRHFTHDEGGELGWAIADSTVTTDLRAVWGASSTDVWAVGDENVILHGNGSTWTRSQAPSLPPSTSFYGIWGSGPNDIWIVGERVILHRNASQGAQ